MTLYFVQGYFLWGQSANSIQFFSGFHSSRGEYLVPHLIKIPGGNLKPLLKTIAKGGAKGIPPLPPTKKI